MNELKKRLEELTRLEEIANKADAAYEAEPENEEKEKAFDAAYKAEMDAFTTVSELIVKMSSGQIDIKTARKMVKTKRNEILNLVA